MIRDLFLNLLFPKYCLGCGKEGVYICKNCEVYLTENACICPVCGQGSFWGETHKKCLGKYTLDGLTSLWDFDGIIRKAIYRIKYGGEWSISNDLISQIENRFNLFSGAYKIAYVPMFKKKENARGFNQSEIIAKELGKKLNFPTIRILEKTKDTRDQASLKKEERKENIKGCFKVLENLAPKIILVDDVFTTGATISECCRVLKNNGAEIVWGFTLARAI